MKNSKVIGWEIFALYRFYDAAATDFGRAILDVWKFVKNRVLGQIVNNKRHDTYKNKFFQAAYRICKISEF